MCFSAEADFASGAVISALGIATLTQVDKPKHLVLGAIPLALGLHQIAEGFVWLGLQDKGSEASTGFAVHLYVAFAWIVLPTLIPLAVLLVEPNERRRRIMAGFAWLGAVVSVYMLWAVVHDDITAHITHDTIQYGGAGDYAVLATVLYVVATCSTPLVSSFRNIRWFGAGNLVAVAVIAELQQDGLTSVWCLWAAIVSVLICLQFAAWRREEQGSEVASPDPAIL
jgi:hypothetical protein